MTMLKFTLRRLSVNDDRETGDTGGNIDFQSMLRIFGACARMLSQVERDLAGRNARQSQWQIKDTGIGSFTIELETPPSQYSRNGNDPDKIASILIDGFNCLEHQRDVPLELKEATLKEVRSVAGALKSKDIEHELLVTSDATKQMGRISHTMARQINRMLLNERITIGSVEGKLELVSIHKGNRKFNVYPSVTGKAVQCDLSLALEKEVIAALGQQVVVSGKIHRNLNGDPVKVTVEKLTVLPEKHQIPTLDDLMGSIPDLTGNLSTEEFIRMIRDDDTAE